MDLVHDFMALFNGLPEAFGTGAGGWVRRAPTREDFERHINGDGDGLGIAPLRRDGTVTFAAIDLDRPDFELAKALVGMLPAPTWIERSRSGNAHIWAFFFEPVEGWVARGVLGAALAALGERGVEVFPKADRLLPDALGSYINLPYHGDKRPILAEIPGEHGLWTMPLPEFLRQVHMTRHDPDEWRSRAAYLDIKSPELRESREYGAEVILHRCAQYMMDHMHERPVTQGTRHAAVFMMAKALRNWRDADDELGWTMLEMFNENGVQPPLAESELRRAWANAAGKTSTGCDDPLLVDYVDPACPIANGRV